MKLILCGGGWAEKTVVPNKIFESLIEPHKPILYIPQARDRDPAGYITCKTWLLGEFKNIKHGEIDTVESLSEVIHKNLSDYAAIFIGGGNTFKLLKELKESGAFNKIQEYINNGGLVYGCSAGAYINPTIANNLISGKINLPAHDILDKVSKTYNFNEQEKLFCIPF